METLLSPMVQVVLDKVLTAMLDRAQVVAEFKNEFEQLEKGLTTMKDLLADSMNLQSKYDKIKGALSQVRELIDEADDVLTDCLVRDIYKENKSSLRLWFHDPGFKLRVGKQLEDINSKMGKARSILGEHLIIANCTAPDKTDHAANQLESNREFMSQNYDPDVTYGLDENIKSLKEWMLGSTKGKLDFVGIVGMGGLGKTTIAKKFYTDEKVISHFDKMIWVSVSRNFSAQRIVKCMLENINLQAPDVSKSDKMFTSLKQGLKDQAYLIVMDDVWPNPDLDNFWTNLRDSLPKKVNKSSCIIITTRDREVARGMVDEDSLILQPPTLNKEHSWSLFSIFAFRSTQGKCPELFEEEGRAIVERCGGLPLAIKTVGGYLARERCLFEWTNTKEKFHSLTADGKTESLMLCLQLSYDELPTDMKQCLLCLSVYPEDFEIHADQLIHWWFGEGLIRSKKGDSKTALELGYEYLAKLANRCLLEVAETRGYDGRIYKFKIHDMIRELIIGIAEKEKFCSFNEECRQIQIEDSRWLCLTEDMAAEVEKPWIKSNSKLRALLLMSSPSMIDFTKNFVLLESLRVLDLSYSKLDVINVEDSNTASSGICVEKLFDTITSLKRLACLNLSGVQKLLEVPSSIEKLLNLQILVLNGCRNLGKIHAKITSLKRLVVLDIGTCPLEHLPRDLGSFSYLQELSGFRVVSRAKTWGCTLLELGKLKQLRVLRITIGDVAKISEKEKKSLSSLQNLKVLAIDAADTCEQENLEMIDELELPQKIEELYLRNYRSQKMPNWFSPLKLPKLHYLSIEDCDVESLKDNCSWKIEGLYLKLLHMLKVDWNNLKRVMPALRYMEISKCSNLKNFPIDVVKPGVWRK